jgi:hypothetical protein
MQLCCVLAGAIEAALPPALLLDVQPSGARLPTKQAKRAARAIQQPASTASAAAGAGAGACGGTGPAPPPCFDGGRPFPELRTSSGIVDVYMLYDQGATLQRRPLLKDLQHEQHSDWHIGWRQRWHEMKAAAQEDRNSGCAAEAVRASQQAECHSTVSGD